MARRLLRVIRRSSQSRHFDLSPSKPIEFLLSELNSVCVLCENEKPRTGVYWTSDEAIKWVPLGGIPLD